jgi:hypothetical protein
VRPRSGVLVVAVGPAVKRREPSAEAASLWPGPQRPGELRLASLAAGRTIARGPLHSGAPHLANVSARNGPAPTKAPTSESLSQPRARQLSCLFHCELHPPSSQVEKLLAIQRILGVFSQPYILAGECSVVLRWQRRRHGGGSHSPRQQCWAIRGVPFVPGSR